jgi:hypothetical protein
LCSALNAAGNSPRWFTLGAVASSCTFSQHSWYVWFQMSGLQLRSSVGMHHQRLGCATRKL